MHVQVGDKASSNHHKKHPAKLQSFSHKVKKHASDTLPDGSAVDSSKIPAVSMATINAHTSTDSKQNTSDSKQSTVTASKGSMRIQHTGAHSRCRQRISRQLAAVTGGAHAFAAKWHPAQTVESISQLMVVQSSDVSVVLAYSLHTLLAISVRCALP